MTSSKYDDANYDRFVPNFGMAYKTIKRVSVPNLKSFGPMKTVTGKRSWRIFYYVIWENGLERSLPHQHGCRNINVQRFSKF